MSTHDLQWNSKGIAVALVVTLAMAHAGWGQKSKSAATPASTPAATTAPAQAAPASNAPMEETMLGYAALDDVMDKVAGFVCDARAQPAKVIVLDLASLQNLQNFDSFYVDAEALNDAFSAMANAPGASSGIDTFADITSAVATAAIASNAETASSFTISDPSPALILLNKLGAKGKDNSVSSCQSPIYAGVYGEDDVGDIRLANVKTKNVNGDLVNVSIKTVQNELSALSQARASAVGCLANAAQCGHKSSNAVDAQPKAQPANDPPGGDPPQAQATSPAANQTTKHGTTPGKSTATGGPAPGAAHNQPSPTRGPVVGPATTAQQTQQQTQQVQNPGTSQPGGAGAQDPRPAAFATLDATYNTFLTGLSAPNAITGAPLLSSILSGFRLRNQLNALNGTAVMAVYVNVAFAGGTQQDRKDLVTNLTTGDWLRYSGAVGVNVIVFTIHGTNSAIKFSDFLRVRTPMEQMHNPAPDKGDPFNAGDNLGDVPATPPVQADKKNQ